LAITIYKIGFSSFHGMPGGAGLVAHLASEWVLVINLLLLIIGFALLARHFEESRVPLLLPSLLPDDWKGGFAMLVVVFVLSSFLDNIAAAMIGGTMATALYRGRVHVGFLAAIVAASNGGGSGSVVGDTTTTMMWIAGVRPAQVFEAYIAPPSSSRRSQRTCSRSSSRGPGSTSCRRSAWRCGRRCCSSRLRCGPTGACCRRRPAAASSSSAWCCRRR